MKKILIPGWSLGENAWGVTKPYLNFFSQFGQVEILTPRTGIVEGDLLVLPGGADMNPRSYCDVPGFETGNTDVFKQYFYDVNLQQYITNKVPVFGICLGFQQLNVFFGGRLDQDYPFDYSSARTSLSEEIVLLEGDTTTKVNSLHHQGVWETNLGMGLKVLAKSKVYGNVEAFKHKELKVAGVQWHPEEIHDKLSIELINNLLN
jgi:putative glutamine amidotransferase